MMKVFIVFVAALTLLACAREPRPVPDGEGKVVEKSSVEADTTISFDGETAGTMPANWSNYFTGKGKPGKWEIRNDNGNKVLAQVSQENLGQHFDVIVMDKPDYQDMELEVKFKGVEGEEDQGGGPVWRYLDENNYYIARANPLENNFRVYKVVDGNRKEMASADIMITSGEWHTIFVRVKGNQIECYYNGKKHLEVADDTFPDGGKIGLWTKADAMTYFDDFKMKSL